MRKVLTAGVFIAFTLLMYSCSRNITPYQAANGKARCGRTLR